MAYRMYQASKTTAHRSRLDLEESYRFGYLTLPAPPQSNTPALGLISRVSNNLSGREFRLLPVC